MPIQMEICDAGAGVIFDCRGSLTLAEMYEANKNFLEDREALKKWRYAIIDLTSIGPMDINYQNVQGVVARNELLAAGSVPGIVLAVACPEDWAYGLARMWQVLVERFGWEIRVVRSRAEAESWVAERVHEKFGLTLAKRAPSPSGP